MRSRDRGAAPAEREAMSGASLVERAAFLRQVEMFAGLDRITLAKVAAHLEPVTVADGAELCRQGEEGDALYVISRGAFGVYAVTPGQTTEARLATGKIGDAVGEMALLTGEPRSELSSPGRGWLSGLPCWPVSTRAAGLPAG